MKILAALLFPMLAWGKVHTPALNIKTCKQVAPEVLASELLSLSAHLNSASFSESCRKKTPRLRYLHFNQILEIEKAGPSGVAQVPIIEVSSTGDLSVQSLSPLQSELNRPDTVFRVEFSVKSLSGKMEKGFFTFIRNANSDDIQNLGCAYFLHQPSLSVSIKTCQ